MRANGILLANGMQTILLLFAIFPATVLGACKPGWSELTGYCYKHFREANPLYFGEANQICLAEGGGVLTPVTGETLLNFLTPLAKMPNDDYYGWQDQPLVGLQRDNGKWFYVYATNDQQWPVYQKFCKDYQTSTEGKDCAILVFDNAKSSIDKKFDRKKTDPCMIPVPCSHKFHRFICKAKALP